MEEKKRRRKERDAKAKSDNDQDAILADYIASLKENTEVSKSLKGKRVEHGPRLRLSASGLARTAKASSRRHVAGDGGVPCQDGPEVRIEEAPNRQHISHQIRVHFDTRGDVEELFGLLGNGRLVCGDSLHRGIPDEMVSDSIKSSNWMSDSVSLMRCKNPVLVGRMSARRNKGKDSVDGSFAASLPIASH
ncbi:hypothetical protein F25303_14396 [Fusarium sp. NRRL 25303]|nr:hypothetical protein F25303_14396 [Fusarium sp. NRRL 25303]